jgi:3-hydroxyacyl-CoA dehydrogenase/enoyl-CoA hydratase/3-hydroxybutyryl-CoA epimerase
MNVFTSEVMKNSTPSSTRPCDAAVKGVVITSGKESFSGGADLSMLKGMFTFFSREEGEGREAARKNSSTRAGKLTGLFRKLETSGKPWVAAINGTCMGGAFELSLACHGRVVAAENPKTSIAPARGQGRHLPRCRRHPARRAHAADAQTRCR